MDYPLIIYFYNIIGPTINRNKCFTIFSITRQRDTETAKQAETYMLVSLHICWYPETFTDMLQKLYPCYYVNSRRVKLKIKGLSLQIDDT